MTELISTPYNPLHNEWFFLTCMLLLGAIAFLRVHFGRGLWLIGQAAFTQRRANQFLRETNNLNVSAYLLPIFIVVVSMMIAHPVWGGKGWSLSLVVQFILGISIFLCLKYLLILSLGHLFHQLYLFEEVVFLSFLFEKVAGLLLFPFLILSIYAPFNDALILKIGFQVLLIFLVMKWGRMLYLGFFKRSFSKTHLFIYLWILEILPLVVITKYFLL